MGRFSQVFAGINALGTAPFKRTLPLVPLALIFVLALIVCAQWRMIVDRIEEVSEEI